MSAQKETRQPGELTRSLGKRLNMAELSTVEGRLQ
jgi:hypothetical protein